MDAPAVDEAVDELLISADTEFEAGEATQDPQDLRPIWEDDSVCASEDEEASLDNGSHTDGSETASESYDSLI